MPGTHYETLGLAPDATPEQVKRAYRRLARKHHPDAGGDGEAFRRVQEAYETLADPESRRAYDRTSAAGRSRGARPPEAGARWQDGQDFPGGSGFGGATIEDLLGGGWPSGLWETFGSGVPFADEAPSGSPGDVHATVRISLERSLLGTEVSVPRWGMAPCPDCGGRGLGPERRIACNRCGGRGVSGLISPRTCQACGGEGTIAVNACIACRGDGWVAAEEGKATVAIPAGTASGAVLRLPYGRPSHAGVGQLHLTVEVEPHPVWSREGDDLMVEIPLTLREAVLGCEVPVSTPDGRRLRLRVPPGIQPGRRLRLRGQGVRNGRNAGDLVATARISVPTSLSPEERAAWESIPGDGSSLRKGLS